jgi:heterodisulfide reductase subunit A-like polyferredoxin
LAVKNALKIKEMNLKTNVYILYRDMMMYGFLEEYYTRARNSGIVFIRYDRHNRPEVAESGGNLAVTVKDNVLGAHITIEAGIVALSTAIVPDRDEKFEKTLSVPRSSEGFYLESHVQLRPVDSYIDDMRHVPLPETYRRCNSTGEGGRIKGGYAFSQGICEGRAYRVFM